MVPKGWKLERIDKIASVNPPKLERPEGGLVSFVSMEFVSAEAKLKKTETKLYEEVSRGFTAFKNMDVLIAKITPCFENGKGALVDGLESGIGFGSTEFHVLRAKTDLVPEFIYYVVNGYEFRVRGEMNMQGSAGQKRVTTDYLRSYKVLVPPFYEQKKIVEILSTWDKAITTTEQLLTNSQQQKKALMQQLLTGNKRLFDDNGVHFEDEWQHLKLSALFNRVRTKNMGQSSNVVTISGQRGLIRQEEFFKKSVASETLDNYFLLQRGQFAYNKSYSNGYPMGAIKRLNRYEYGVVTTLYICFELIDEKKSSSDFWEHYFESGLLNRALSQIAHEGGRAHGLLNVKPADFFDLKVPVPSFQEQSKITNVLNSAAQEVIRLQNKLYTLKQEKKALMQQLLTGKRRVKVDDEEAA